MVLTLINWDWSREYIGNGHWDKVIGECIHVTILDTYEGRGHCNIGL